MSCQAADEQLRQELHKVKVPWRIQRIRTRKPQGPPGKRVVEGQRTELRAVQESSWRRPHLRREVLQGCHRARDIQRLILLQSMGTVA